jgi:hypothetical protein
LDDKPVRIIEWAKQNATNVITSNFMVRLNHTLSENSFYEFTVSQQTNSDETAKMIDHEVRKLIDEAYIKTKNLYIMNFKKISENKYTFTVDNDDLSIIISKFIYHNVSFELTRDTENTENLNLFKIFNIIKSIIFDYAKNKPEVDEYFIIFNDNDRINKEKWIKACRYYVSRQDVKMSILREEVLVFKINK